eukprot:5318873-Pyramimonas_sp.AAC.1
MHFGASAPHRHCAAVLSPSPHVDTKFRTWLFYVLISVFCGFRLRPHVSPSFTRPRCSAGHACSQSTARAFQQYTGPCQYSGSLRGLSWTGMLASWATMIWVSWARPPPP